NASQGRLRSARWTDGVRGHALAFDRAGSGFEFGSAPRCNFGRNAAFTVAGWVRTRTADGSVVSLRNSRDRGPLIDVNVSPLGELAFLVREDGAGDDGHAMAVGRVVTDGRWHHFTGVRHSGGVAELFIDGTSAAKAAGPRAAGPITTDLRFLG